MGVKKDVRFVDGSSVAELLSTLTPSYNLYEEEEAR